MMALIDRYAMFHCSFLAMFCFVSALKTPGLSFCEITGRPANRPSLSKASAVTSTKPLSVGGSPDGRLRGRCGLL